jgi:hypothetical protein
MMGGPSRGHSGSQGSSSISNSNAEEGQFVNRNHDGAAASSVMMALELEPEEDEEQESLLEETRGEATAAAGGGYNGTSRAAASLTFRRGAAASRAARAAVLAPHRVLGFLRDRVGHHFTSRNVLAIVLLSVLVVFLLRVDTELEEEHYRPEEVLPKSPHRSSFWDVLPKSNANGEEVKSIAVQNSNNYVGFYWHHPLESPYADDLYASISSADRAKLQADFDARRAQYGAKFGLWVHPKAQGVEYPKLDPKNDTSLSNLKPSAWQLNQPYLSEFLSEGIRLVQRVQRAIYEEYGYNSSTTDPKTINKIFHTAVVKDAAALLLVDPSGSGVGALTVAAWEALLRKLCHAIVTHDTLFVVAVGGDPGSDVNFVRTGPMQFHYILEPVLDMLGVRLVTRNIGGTSPTIAALGGANVLGEADVLVVYNDNKLSTGELELLQRQSILSGDRVPVILGASPGDAFDESAIPLSEAWVGRVFSRRDVCPPTEHGKLPDRAACQYLNCEATRQHPALCKKFEGVCWENRTDFSTPFQDPEVGNRFDTNTSFVTLNYRQHQWEGRKLSLLLLQALNETLHRWSNEISRGNAHLQDDMWHVNGRYAKLRETVRTHRNRAEGNKDLIVSPTACESLLASVDPMICHMSMKVLTEWTPRVDPWTNSLRARVNSGFEDPNEGIEELYGGYDLLPPRWIVLDSDVDVHMVAIATNETIEEFRSQTVGMGEGQDDDSNPDKRDDEGDRRAKATRSLKRKKPASQSPADGTASKWLLYNTPIGFCDGSSQASCNRQESNPCLLANRQFYKGGFLSSGTSDWLRVTIPSVSEGVVLLRLDWNANVKLESATPGEVRGRNRLDRLPDDFVFEYSVGSPQTVQTLDRDSFLEFGISVAPDLVVYPVLVNAGMSHNTSVVGEPMELQLRVRTEKAFKVLLTHIYYA